MLKKFHWVIGLGLSAMIAAGWVLSVEQRQHRAETIPSLDNSVWQTTLKDYTSALAAKGVDAQTLTPSQREQALQELFVRESLVQQAEQQGLADDAEFKAKIEEFRRDQLAQLMLEQQIERNMPDFSARAKELYQARLTSHYTQPLRLQLRVISQQLVDPVLLDAVLAKLEQARTDIQSGKLAFAQAAQQFTARALPLPNAATGEWFQVGQLTDSVFESASQLDINALSPVIVAKDGIYLVQLLAKKAPEVQTFAAVEPDLLKELETEYRNSQRTVLLEQLRAEFKQK